MCGRTASTRPPNVLIRVTGAARYIPAAPRPRPPRDGAGGRGGGGRQRGGRQGQGQGQGQGQRPAPRQRYQQHNQQPQPESGAEADTEAAAEDNDAPTGEEEEKEPEEDSTQQYSDAYRPSYNAGPHFYLPVLRYVKNGKDDDDAEEDDSADKASGRTNRTASDEPATAAEKQTETQQLAADEDLTTDGRDDLPTFNPAATLPQPTPTPTPTTTSNSSSSPTSDPSVELVLQPMRWGLIPHWTSATSLAAADAAQSYNLINARAENVDQAKSYRSLLKRRRCVVVVDSYYEWHTQTIHGRTKKQPFSFIPNHHTPPLTQPPTPTDPAHPPLPIPVSQYDRSSDNKPFFLLAALYDTWTDPSPPAPATVHSVTILTTSASQKLGWCHERQPVILTHANALRWLDVWNVPWGEELRAMVCRPWSDGVTWYKVPECVGSVRNQVSECTQPLEEYVAAKKAAGIGKFFGATSTTPSKTVGGEQQQQQQEKNGEKVEGTAGKSVDDGVSVDEVAKPQQPNAVKAETASVKAESVGLKSDEARHVKREREDSASTMLRTPKKKMKMEGSRSRSVSPASGGSVVKKEELSKNQMSLSSFFSRQ